MSYFGLTLHYIDEVDNTLELNNRVLLIRQIDAEKKDATYLRSKILDYMIEFDLMSCIDNKIVFVSDRGPGISAACRSFQSMHCFAHMVHNVVEKMFEKNSIVQAVSVIVKYFKASGLNAIFEQTLKSYVATRWNTIYQMLDSVIERWDEIVRQLRSRKVHQKELDMISLEELELIRDFLKPFSQAIVEAEVTKRTSIDIVSPWFSKLKAHLKPGRTDSELIAHLKGVGHSYWLKSVEPNITLWHDIAVFLNPLMKGLKNYNETQRNRVYARVAELMDNFMPVINLTRDESNGEPSQRDSTNISEAMREFLDTSDDGANSETSELEEYKSKRVSGYQTNMQWWQQNKTTFPRLYGVARYIFAIPASSAGPERLFSSAGRLVHFRPNIRSEMVDEILFLKSNIDLFGTSTPSDEENENYVELADIPASEDEGVVLVHSMT